MGTLRENRERKSFVRFTVGYEIIVLFLEGERACNSIAHYKVKVLVSPVGKHFLSKTAKLL